MPFDTTDCIDGIQHVANRLQKSPTVGDYSEHRRDTDPSADTIINRFSSWNEGLREAGLDVNLIRNENPTEEGCLEALIHVEADLGKSPTIPEYRENRRETDPSKNSIYSLFGSWNDALRAAGLNVNAVVTKNPTEGGCLEALEHVREELGRSPTLEEYNEYRRDADPSQATIRRMFGSWNDALQAAGLSVNVITSPTEEGCLETLEYVTDALGHSPTVIEYSEYRRDTDPSHKTISNLFGSWNEAKRTADILAYDDGNGLNYPYGPSWDSQREAALTRDGACQDCGLSNEEHRNITGRSLDVHHLHKLRRFYDSLSDEDISRLASDGEVPVWLEDEMRRRTERANDLSNLVALCRECHLDIERFSVDEQVTRLAIGDPGVSPDGVRIPVDESGQSSLEAWTDGGSPQDGV